MATLQNQHLPERAPSWFTEKTLSARAQSIVAAREELLGLLNDVPETDYELSFTDLVEKKSPATDEANSLVETINVHTSTPKEKLRRWSSRVCRSSSDGVLLNMYMPTSLARSLTARSRSNRETSRSNTAESVIRGDESNAIGCWQILWDTKRSRSRRQQLEEK